jgi:hypothetical protein
MPQSGDRIIIRNFDLMKNEKNSISWIQPHEKINFDLMKLDLLTLSHFTKHWCSSKKSGKIFTLCLKCGDSKLFYDCKPLNKCLNWYQYVFLSMVQFEFEVLLETNYFVLLILKVKGKRIKTIICLLWVVAVVFFSYLVITATELQLVFCQFW